VCMVVNFAIGVPYCAMLKSFLVKAKKRKKLCSVTSRTKKQVQTK
jgi:hypothetical protein